MKLKKRVLCLIISAVMMLGFIAGATASSGIMKIAAEINTNISYRLNGDKFIPRDVDGSKMDTIIYKGRSYVPLRALSEALNVPVDWDDKTSTIILGIDEEIENAEKEYEEEITLLHFNQDEATALAKDFMETHPGVKVNIKCISDTNGAYQNYLTIRLRSGAIDADVIALEYAFVKRYVDYTNAFENLSSAPYNAEEFNEKLVPYTIDVGRSTDGKMRALAHYSTPTGIGYKRDLAMEYLKTDSPEEVSKMFASSEKILETAIKIKEKSLGKVKLFPNLVELFRIYLGSRSTGWLKNGELLIDPKIDEFMELSKKLHDEGVVGNLQPWSPEWANAIRDNEHFAWTMPSWGVPWIISVNMEEQYRHDSKWGIALPEVPGFLGGTWMGVHSGSSKKELAWEFIKYTTTNSEFSNKWVIESGDFSSNMETINKLAEEDLFISPTINQNLYSLYKPVLSKINGKTMTRFDDIIVNVFIEYALYPYINGEVSKDKAIEDFKEFLHTEYSIGK